MKAVSDQKLITMSRRNLSLDSQGSSKESYSSDDSYMTAEEDLSSSIPLTDSGSDQTNEIENVPVDGANDTMEHDNPADERERDEREITLNYIQVSKTELANIRPAPPTTIEKVAEFENKTYEFIQKLEDVRDSMQISGETYPDISNEFVRKANELRDFMTQAYQLGNFMVANPDWGGRFAANLAAMVAAL